VFTKIVTLTVFSALEPVPFPHLLSKVHAAKINSLAEKLFDKSRKTLLWVYNMEIVGIDTYIKDIKHDFLIYDCVDNYAGFPRYDTRGERKRKSMSRSNTWQAEPILFLPRAGVG